MLVAAAAKEWGGSTAGIRVEDGMVISPRGAKLPFGAVAEAASKLTPPSNPKLTDPGDFRLIGTSAKRLDTPMKVNGTAVYGIDVRLPGMVYAALAQPPVLGGKAKSFDATAAKSMPGVQAVVETSSGIAVVADSWWRARKARDALKIQWDAGRNAGLNDAQITRTLQQAASKTGKVARNDGDVDAAIASAAKS
jgi:isoquinoline 1-oxidoreductase beta subunit